MAAEMITMKYGVTSSAEFCAKAAALAGRLRDKDGPFEPALPIVAAKSAGAAILLAAKGTRAVKPSSEWPMLQLGLLVARGEILWPKPAWEG